LATPSDERVEHPTPAVRGRTDLRSPEVEEQLSVGGDRLVRWEQPADRAAVDLRRMTERAASGIRAVLGPRRRHEEAESCL
jgi:hypothetical protein